MKGIGNLVGIALLTMSLLPKAALEMKKQLIVTTVYLFFLLALIALVEIVWNQEPEQPAIETPAATTTPAPTPTGPLTIQITGLEGAESIDDVWAVIEIPH